MEKYTIAIDIKSSATDIWKILTDFSNYPQWNSILKMEGNDHLEPNKDFQVTIIRPKGKPSRFKAITLSKTPNKSFVARQTIVAKWFFEATHYFTLEPIDKKTVNFTQEWHLNGIIAKLFKKAIFKELSLFKTMNNELKTVAETQ